MSDDSKGAVTVVIFGDRHLILVILAMEVVDMLLLGAAVVVLAVW